MVLPTSWVQCQAPVGQVSRGTHRLQACGGCRPPLQCEGFLCSVVFLTPKGGGSLGGAKAAAGLARLLFQCSLWLLGGRWSAGGGRPAHGPASGIHGAWAPMSLVCALQS